MSVIAPQGAPGASDRLGSEAARRLVPRSKALRLDQLMLAGTVTLVVVIVILSGALQAISTRNEFGEAARLQQVRLEEQARNIGRLFAHLIATTSASALRDNNYAFLSELVGPLVSRDSNILRVRILDRESHVVGDTDPEHTEGLANIPVRGFINATYRGQLTLEYREPIEEEPGKSIGAVILSYSLEPLQAELGRLQQAKRTSVRRITLRTTMLGVAFALIGAVLAGFQSRRVTQPLGALTRGALRLAEGDLKARVEQTKKAGSEVLTLSIVFNHMADQIARLLEDVRTKVQLEHQMEVARTVQESLLPERTPLEFGALRIAGLVSPAEQCGGDWWLSLRLDDRRAVLGIGDATGHGLSTALIATAACSGFTAAVHSRLHVDAPGLMDALNRTLFAMGGGRYQMTCSIAIFDITTGELEMSSGGHPFPFVYHRSTAQVTSLVAKGPRIGDRPDADFGSVRLRLAPDDVVVWFSDGVVECENDDSRPYGSKRLRAAIEKHGRQPAAELRDALLADVEQFSNRAREDDMTVVVAEYAPRASAGRQ